MTPESMVSSPLVPLGCTITTRDHFPKSAKPPAFADHVQQVWGAKGSIGQEKGLSSRPSHSPFIQAWGKNKPFSSQGLLEAGTMLA